MAHANARLGPAGRRALVALMIDEGMTERQAAACLSVGSTTAHRWRRRWLEASEHDRRSGAWTADRSSRPHRSPARTAAAVEKLVCAERRRTGWGPRLIAGSTGVAHSTVHAILRRHNLSRIPKAPREAVVRFEWPCPGDLLQMDTKRFGRFTRPGHRMTGDRHSTGAEKRRKVGWEFCHSIIDDHSRIAYSELHADERAETVIGFLRRALAFYDEIGITPQRLQTDNAWTYTHNRALAELLARQGIRHRTIPPRTPKRNGKICVLASACRPAGRRGSPRPVV
jgi:transposase